MKGEHNRDRAIEQLLRETRRDAAAAQSCVDAESLAAWGDGVLPPAEARRVEAHASACDRCQAMLAAFARAEPAPRAPAEPFWHRWRLQWLAPVAAMATALAVWVAVPRDRPPSPLPATAAVAERTTLGAAPPDAGVAGMIDRTGPAEARTMPPSSSGQLRASASAALRKENQPVGPAGSRRDEEVSRNASGGREADSTLERAPRRQEDGRGAAGQEAAAVVRANPRPQTVPSAAAKDSARRATSEKSEAVSEAARALSATPPVAGPPPSAPVSSPTAADLGAAVPPPIGVGRMDARSAPAPLDVASPDAVHRWRVDSGGRLQHSASRGATWQPVTLAAPDVLTAGISPEGSVCWLVGRNGAVFVTTDGLRFDRRAVPEPVDLISVGATDARHATVATANGRTFITTDGGVTWTPGAP